MSPKRKFLSFKGEFFETLIKAVKSKKEILLFFTETFLFFYGKIHNFFFEKISVLKNARTDIKFASLNNFNLARAMLKENKITDALFRLHLANVLRKNSPVILYYLGYVYFIKGDLKKSLKYILQSLKIRSNFKNAKILLEKIEKANIKK